MLRFNVDGGPPNASDRLVVRDDGTGDLVLVRQSAVPGSGSVTVAPAVNTVPGSDVIYQNVERVDVLPVDPVTGGTGTGAGGRVVVFQPDPFEMNDNRLIATDFSDLNKTILNPTIDPGGTTNTFGPGDGLPGDEDWYKFTPGQTSTFRFDVRFDTISTVPSGRLGLPGNGSLDAAVYDSNGALIVSGTTITGFGEQVAFGAEGGHTYYLRVKGAPLANGASIAINTYTAGVTNLDTSGPQITGVGITGQPAYNLFTHKPTANTPTPLVNGLSIGIEDFPARAPGFLYPALIGGTVTEQEPNSSLADAQNIDQYFNLASDPNIGDQTQNTSTQIPHATILGTGDGTFDYYSFTVNAPGVKGIFDIDGANNAGAQINTELFLYDQSGNLLGQNDDSPITFGAGGSTSILDPYLEHVFAAAGTYIIGVARFSSTGNPGGITGTPLAAGDAYKLQVSVTGHIIELNPGLFQVRGDQNGVIAIQQVQFVPDPVVVGQPATGTINLTFFTPLPDDRYTLTVFDSLTDPAGNKLDGESNAIEPQFVPSFPSGNGVAGGNFVARFTVDSRPEIATYSGKTVAVDINGNGFFDPANTDATNRDLVFQFGVPSDQRFAGKLSPTMLPGFDVLAAYGRVDGTYRFLIDRNGNGRVDDPTETIVSPVQANALAVAGNFDGNAANGDEIALFDGSKWYILNNALTAVVTTIDAFSSGYPLAGDFDGDGKVDLATYQNGNFYIVFGSNGLGGPVQTINFQMPGVLNRPVAADMDQDGITDLGLWIPYGGAQAGTGEWRFLLSNDLSKTARVTGSANTLNHRFSPTPLGADVVYEFGDPVALPLVGNFDPPVAATTGGTTGSSSNSTQSSTSPANTPTAPIDPAQARSYVASLYHDVLGRAPDAGGWDNYVAQLQAGVTKQAVAQSLLTSAEHYGRVVDGFYATYLHRDADAPGRSSWISAMLQGESEDQVAAGFLLSTEYAAINGGDQRFVDALYQDVFGRGADSGGEANYLAALSTGTPRDQVVASFMSSTERYHHVVDQLYGELLHRSADALGLQFHSDELQSGQLTARTLEVALLASDEYFAKSHGG